jgi:hypothetical protein
MKKLLEAKHWQLFMLIVGIHIVSLLLIRVNAENLLFYEIYLPWIWPIPVVIFYGWLWSIFFHFKGYRPKGSKSYGVVFVASSLCSLSLLFASVLYAIRTDFISSNEGSDAIGWLNLLFVLCTLCCIVCVSRIIKLVELHRTVRLIEYLGDFFLMLFYPIGIWIIQPRINRIVLNLRLP